MTREPIPHSDLDYLHYRLGCVSVNRLTLHLRSFASSPDSGDTARVITPFIAKRQRRPCSSLPSPMCWTASWKAISHARKDTSAPNRTGSRRAVLQQSGFVRRNRGQRAALEGDSTRKANMTRTHALYLTPPDNVNARCRPA